MPIMMLLFWVPLLLVIAWGLRQITGPRDEGRGGDRGAPEDPREVVRRRYAR